MSVKDNTIGAGDTVQFTAMARYPDGSTVNITGQATWSSSDTEVATINAEGLVTGESEGTTEITAAFDGETSDPFTLTVNAAAAAFQWWAVLAIIAALFALALLLFAIVRRRGGGQLEEA